MASLAARRCGKATSTISATLGAWRIRDWGEGQHSLSCKEMHPRQAALQAGETGENPPHILGLHVVEQILAAHGGTAAFAQALPHGAAAALTLPL